MSKIREINTKLNSKEISAVEITTIYLDNLEKTSPIIGSYISTTKKEALAKANLVDAQIAKGEETGLLAGVPMGIKE